MDDMFTFNHNIGDGWLAVGRAAEKLRWVCWCSSTQHKQLKPRFEQGVGWVFRWLLQRNSWFPPLLQPATSMVSHGSALQAPLGLEHLSCSRPHAKHASPSKRRRDMARADARAKFLAGREEQCPTGIQPQNLEQP